MSPRPSTSIATGAPICLLVSLSAYLYLEGTVTYQLAAIAFTMAALFQGHWEGSQRLVVLLTLFMSAGAGMYALLYEFSPLLVGGCLLAWAGFVLLQPGWLKRKMEIRRFVAVVAAYALIILVCDLARRAVFPSALLATAITGALAEIPAKRHHFPWPHWQGYATVAVLGAALLLVSPAAFHS